MKRILIISLVYIFLLSTFVWFASAPQGHDVDQYAEIMGTSNQLYAMEEYALAADGYRQLLDQGVVDAPLYYNMGNALYKQGDPGQAILFYLRAAQLSPRDEDIRTNLDLARSLRVDKLDEGAGSSNNPINHLLLDWMTVNELSLVTLTLWYALSVLVIIIFNSQPGSHVREAAIYGTFVVLALFLAGAFTLGNHILQEKSRPSAVIVAQEVDVTSGPGEQYITEFTLHSGTEVNLLETRVNWARIALPGGEMQGWLPQDAVEKVNFPSIP